MQKKSLVKKSIKKGSSLFELLVYMAIGLVLLSMGSLWVQHAYIPFWRASAKITNFAVVASGLAVLKHDLCRAPSNTSYWKKISEHELIWSVPGAGGGTSFGAGIARPESGGTVSGSVVGISLGGSAESAGAVGVAIGWQYQDGQLARVEGQYDAATQTWTQATKSVVAQGIKQFSFSVNYSHRESHSQSNQAQAVSSIKIEYVVDGTSYTQFFALRKRVF